MTHMTSGGGSPVALRTLAITGFKSSLDRDRLREAIAVRRQRLAECEADLVAACERSLAYGAGDTSASTTAQPGTVAAWSRYIGTSLRLEPEFMPEMLRLIRDIERLERLAALPATSQASAA